MKPKVQIKCDSLDAREVQVIIDGNIVDPYNIVSLDVKFRPGEAVTAVLELAVNKVDIKNIALSSEVKKNNSLPPPNKPPYIDTGFLNFLRRK